MVDRLNYFCYLSLQYTQFRTQNHYYVACCGVIQLKVLVQDFAISALNFTLSVKRSTLPPRKIKISLYLNYKVESYFYYLGFEAIVKLWMDDLANYYPIGHLRKTPLLLRGTHFAVYCFDSSHFKKCRR